MPNGERGMDRTGMSDMDGNANESSEQFAPPVIVEIKFRPIKHASVFSKYGVRYAGDYEAGRNEKNCFRGHAAGLGLTGWLGPLPVLWLTSSHLDLRQATPANPREGEVPRRRTEVFLDDLIAPIQLSPEGVSHGIRESHFG